MKILAAALLVAALPAHAAEEFCGSGKPHSIDVRTDAGMEKATTTVDMREVQGRAYQAWDRELNRVYRELLRGLDKDSAAKLKKAQKAWLLWRDSETAWLWSEAMHGNSGTAGPLNVSGAGTEMVRQRTCDLMNGLRVRGTAGD